MQTGQFASLELCNRVVCRFCGHQQESTAPGHRCPHDGSVLIGRQTLADNPHDPFLGTVLADRYAITDRLGNGGYSTVYRAVQEPLNRAVAIKIMRHEACQIDANAAQRFLREAQVLARISNPHCASIHDYAQTTGGVSYMVQELVRGETLSQVLKAGGRMDPTLAADIACQILSALGDAHRSGVLHRDIKPSNIMLDRQHGGIFARLIDFGIAKPFRGLGGDLTCQGVLVGTPGFMPPERILQLDEGPTADLYAVAAVLYNAVAGVRPFSAETTFEELSAHVERELAPLPKDYRVPKHIEQVLRRAMSKQPKDRYRTADEMRRALSQEGSLVPLPVLSITETQPGYAALESIQIERVATPESKPVLTLVSTPIPTQPRPIFQLEPPEGPVETGPLPGEPGSDGLTLAERLLAKENRAASIRASASSALAKVSESKVAELRPKRTLPPALPELPVIETPHRRVSTTLKSPSAKVPFTLEELPVLIRPPAFNFEQPIQCARSYRSRWLLVLLALALVTGAVWGVSTLGKRPTVSVSETPLEPVVIKIVGVAQP